MTTEIQGNWIGRWDTSNIPGVGGVRTFIRERPYVPGPIGIASEIGQQNLREMAAKAGGGSRSNAVTSSPNVGTGGAGNISMRQQAAPITTGMNTGAAENRSNPYLAQMQNLMQGQFSGSDPSYQWRFDQGQKALERSLAAKGLLGSGNAATELQQYGQGMASQEFQNQFNRVMGASNTYEGALSQATNRLAQLAGIDLGQQQLQFNVDTTNQNMGQRQYEFGAGMQQRQYEFDANQSLQKELQRLATSGGGGGQSLNVAAQSLWNQMEAQRQYDSGLQSAVWAQPKTYSMLGSGGGEERGDLSW